jgi:hypothetical protein
MSNPFAKFYALLSLLPKARKEDLVFNYSSGYTTSLQKMYEDRPKAYQAMIMSMEQMANVDKEKEIKKKRSAVLLRLQMYGVDTTSWDKVNAFMRQPRIAGKTLGELCLEELTALIPKLESILQKQRQRR